MSDPLFSVADQVVFITGGTRGIGRAITEGFGERKAQVAVCSRDVETVQQVADELSNQGHRVYGLACDVSSEAEIQRTVDAVIERFGRIDTLVNCAGVNRRKRAESVTSEDYDFIMNINLRGALLVSQRVAEVMRAQKGGSIINIESLNTHMPLKGVLPYAMSKFGMQGMTRGLALEWGPLGIRVNSLAPGFILTDMTSKLWSNPVMQRWNETNAPLGRLGVPQDMVGTAVFLASAASAFMTGQTLYVDGGFSSGWNWPIPLDDPARVDSGS